MTASLTKAPLIHQLAPSWLQQPLDPSAEQARTWLREELAKAKYHAQPSLIERLQEALQRWLASLGGGPGLPAWVVPVVVLLVLAMTALIVLRVLRREPASTARTGTGALFDTSSEAAKGLRARAETALASGDADTALLDGYRALVASCIERTLIEDRPGRTAHEAAGALTPVFPSEAGHLGTGADTFDAVRYGGRHTTLVQAREVLDLDRRLRETRPRLPDLDGGGPLPNLPGLSTGQGALVETSVSAAAQSAVSSPPITASRGHRR